MALTGMGDTGALPVADLFIWAGPLKRRSIALDDRDRMAAPRGEGRDT